MKASLILVVALASALAFTASASATAGSNRRLLQGPVKTVDPWTVGQTYPDLNLAAGTAVNFVWMGTHGVAKIPSGTCPTSYNGVPGVSVVAPIASGSSFTTPPLAAGTYWYSCPVPGHCEGGQLQKIIVA